MNSGHQAWQQVPLPRSWDFILVGLVSSSGIQFNHTLVNRSDIDSGRRGEWPGGIDEDRSKFQCPQVASQLWKAKLTSTGSTHSKETFEALVITESAIFLER